MSKHGVHLQECEVGFSVETDNEPVIHVLAAARCFGLQARRWTKAEIIRVAPATTGRR